MLVFLHNFYLASEIITSSVSKEQCPNNLATICNLQCPNGKYLLDAKGCPTCACASDTTIKPIGPPPNRCPLIKCRANCGPGGYKLDENGCQICECVSENMKDMIPKPYVECPQKMCRMYCMHGFSRDENGCEICKCNDSPQPCPIYKCGKVCLNGYRKDYRGKGDCYFLVFVCLFIMPLFYFQGCQTCQCEDDEAHQIVEAGCSPMKCNLDCKYGFERDPSGCSLCSCNRCPLYTCRMFCMYGFKKNSDGCDICECDWTPVSEKIECSAVDLILKIQNKKCNRNLNYLFSF